MQDAIAMQDTQPKRSQLRAWFEAKQEQEMVAPSYLQMLLEAVNLGQKAILSLLRNWTQEERWEAILGLEAVSVECSKRFVELVPNWISLWGS